MNAMEVWRVFIKKPLSRPKEWVMKCRTYFFVLRQPCNPYPGHEALRPTLSDGVLLSVLSLILKRAGNCVNNNINKKLILQFIMSKKLGHFFVQGQTISSRPTTGSHTGIFAGRGLPDGPRRAQTGVGPH